MSPKSPSVGLSPLSDLDDIIIDDTLKDRDLKEWINKEEEINSKTLRLLKKRVNTLANSREFQWMDIGCGDGRCLSVLQMFLKANKKSKLKRIHYLGVDKSKENIEKAEECSSNFSVDAKFLESDAKEINYISRFDIISAILFLHEVDAIFLPNILWNLLNALNEKGSLLISDFNNPYEQEKEIIIWSYKEIISIVEDLGGLVERFEILESMDVPNLWFYNLCIRRYKLNPERLDNFLDNYAEMLKNKMYKLGDERASLETALNARMCDILGKQIPSKKLSKTDRRLLKDNLSLEDRIAYRRKLLIQDQINTLLNKTRKMDKYLAVKNLRSNKSNMDNDFYREILDIISRDEYYSIIQSK